MEKKWAGTTYGNSWMHAKLITMLRYVDVRVFYAFCAVFVIPVCLCINPSCGIIYRYFRRRFGLRPLRAFWMTYKNHCLFAQVVIDKFAMYAGRHFEVKVEGYEHFRRLEQASQGFVQLSSHIGNYEMAGYSLKTERKEFFALVYGGEKASVMAQRDKLLTESHIHMIPVSADMSHLFDINAALSDGHIVSMPADRLFGSNKSITVTLLGTKAKLPMGAFRVAAMRGLDVVAVNVMKTSAKGYTAYVTPLPYDKAAGRTEQIQQLADAYAAELERMLRQYPAQWYNYFEFFEQ